MGLAVPGRLVHSCKGVGRTYGYRHYMRMPGDTLLAHEDAPTAVVKMHARYWLTSLIVCEIIKMLSEGAKWRFSAGWYT